MRLATIWTALTATLLSACAPVVPPAELAAPAPSPAAARRPNIVFIMSDDHAVQAVSAYGHPVSRLAPTPNIDRIARNGATFTNSFVTNSLCGPSRAAMLTGKFGNKNGFNKNGEQFDNSQPTWPHMLADAGYQTAIVGKWHINRAPTGMGYNFWKVIDDQGEYYNPDFITPAGKVRQDGYVTDIVTADALDWLKSKRAPEQPFALMIHHKAAHRNFMPALRHVQKYDGVTFPVPPTYFDDYAGRPAAAAQEMNIYRDMYEGHDLKMTKAVGTTKLRYNRWPNAFERMSPDQRRRWDELHQADNDAMNAADLQGRDMAAWKYQRYMREYLGTIASMDEGIGEVLDYLEATGLDRNTIVVYTSDQGFYLGEHGWFDKRFMYEESLRTPLLIQYPGHIAPGTKVDELVQNIDYAPAFLQWAGLPVPAAIQGRSLAGLAEGRRPADWREAIYYHYHEFPGFHSVRAHYGVRDGRYKLMRFYGDIDQWEFYDLQTDPTEVRNRIDDPALRGRIAAMKRRLAALREQYEDTAGPPVFGRAPAGAPRGSGQ